MTKKEQSEGALTYSPDVCCYGNSRDGVLTLGREVVTLCAPRARARAVFGPDKCKDLCGHAQFLLRNVPDKAGARPVSKT